MKVLKRIGLVVLGLFLAAVVLFFISKPWYYRLFYPWDRITGTIHVEIDGQNYALTAEQIVAYHGTNSTAIKCIKKENSTDVSIHAGGYGEYSFWIYLDEVSQPVEIVCYQYNWWNIRHFSLSLSVDNTENIITADCRKSCLNEEGEWVLFEQSMTADLDDSILRFSI